MPTAAAPAPPQTPPPPPATQGPQIIEIAGSPVPPAATGGAPHSVAPGQPPASTPANTAAAHSTASSPTGPVQAKAGASLLGRVLALLPIATGVVQVVLGLMITRGTVSLAAVPVLGALPKFVVGGLVTSTAMPSIMQGVRRLLGKS